MRTRLVPLGLLCAAGIASAVTVSSDELRQSREWAAAAFGLGLPDHRSNSPAPCLMVLANHDPVIRNNRGGKPLHLDTNEFTRGLYCHAFSKIVVRLSEPARAFTAFVGVDSNEQTSGGRGSVDFSVIVANTEKFRSGILREGMRPKAVDIDLAGATEFLLQVAETSDGIACDQADWADAKVTMRSGEEVWLGDLPLVQPGDGGRFSTNLPFSFVYGGKTSSNLLPAWKAQRRSRQLAEGRTEHTVTWRDESTALAARCVAVEYADFPIVEWTLYFRNEGSSPTPIIERIQALDLQCQRAGASEFLLHHNVGSPADGSDYGPLETRLKPGAKKSLGAAGGRPTNKDWSYFNLETGTGTGLIAAIGWPGQWAAELACDNGRGLRLTAGQELTHFKLLPGEEIRSPLIVLQFWSGDWIRAQNIWRRWMQAHSMPRPAGHLPPPQFVASSSRQYDEMIKANETNQVRFIDRYLAENLKLDYWWMDAGWYLHDGGGWPHVGTWLVDSNRFPHGLRAVSDYAHIRDIKIVVWFEPERVTQGSWLARAHPDWVLGGSDGGLLNLGNAAARQWLIEHVDRTITEQGIDLYRQDFNMDPLPYWRANDPPDRQGITENNHVTGYLAFWDELCRRHPNLLIDSCASGGRRNDIETMRRAVPLWRSDYAYETSGHQCMTHGISLWLPYHGTGTVAARNASYYGSGRTPVEPYAFWSNVSPSLGFGVDMRVRDLDYSALRRLVGAWREVVTNFFGDYYPLTPWTRDSTAWMAWQFNRPETGGGLVEVFRRENSFYESGRFKLFGLEPRARYRFTDLESAGAAREIDGAELADIGLQVVLAKQPGVAVLKYERLLRSSKTNTGAGGHTGYSPSNARASIHTNESAYPAARTMPR